MENTRNSYWTEDILKMLFFMLLFVSVTSAFTSNAQNIPAFVGDWKGIILETDDDSDIVARVIGLGHNEYRIQLLPEFDKRAALYMDIQSKSINRKIRFSNTEWSGEISDEYFKGTRQTVKYGIQTFELKKVERLSPTIGRVPPKEAIVLFNGEDFNEWIHPGNPERNPVWKLKAGVMESVPGLKIDGNRQKNDLITKRNFTDFELHLEFKLPYSPEKRDQGRCNSGIFLQDFYEVQILDSYGLAGLWNQCGALYKMAPPKVNMCSPPEQWQTYDIVYHAPRFNDLGIKLKNALVTVSHNGKVIHNQTELVHPTAHSGKQRKTDNAPHNPAPIKIQDHGNSIQFRNIWIKEFENGKI